MSSSQTAINTSTTQSTSTKFMAVANLSKMSLVKAFIIWGLAALFYFYDYLLQVSPAAMKHELMASLAKEAEQFGSLSAYCLYAYGIMQIPAGVLLDRFGPRKIITFACTLCAVGSLVFGWAESLWVAKLGRILIGAGAGFALLSCLKIVSLWFPRQRYALMTGATVTIGFLGAAFGLSCVGSIVEITGWRPAMYWGGLIGLLLSVLLWWIIKDKPSQTTMQAQTSTQASNSANTSNTMIEPAAAVDTHAPLSILQSLTIITKDSQTWIAALFAGLMFVPTLAFGGLWGIPFLEEAHGFDRTTAGLCTSLIYVGWMFGGAFWGFISDYCGRRNAPMMVATLATLVLTLILIYVENLSPFALKALLFGLGFFSSSFIVAFAVIVEIHSSNMAATASGFANALNTLWGALAQPFIGWMLDMNGSASAVAGQERIFSLAEYQQAFLVLPICLVISFLILLKLKETYCQPRKSQQAQTSTTMQQTA